MGKRFISIILTLLLFTSVCALNTFSAAADDHDVHSENIPTYTGPKNDLASLGYNVIEADSQSVENALIEQASELPDTIDLRNYNGMNYVTPVKFQNPFGTCWAFGIAGASEISFIYENGLGVPAGEVNNSVDFSEKHIAWYMYHAITEDDVVTGAVRASQIGEGYDPSEAESTNVNAVYSFGGDSTYASNFFASGHGPVTEDYPVNDEYPYYYAGSNRWRVSDRYESEEVAQKRKEFFKSSYRIGVEGYIREGYIESADEYDAWFDENWGEGFFLYEKSHARNNYAGYDDWSLPLNAEYRFPAVASFFKNSYVLPGMAAADSDGNYVFKEAGLAAIKIELSKGHGVAIGYLADQSLPGQEIGDAGYMNTTNWAQYYNGPADQNHAVTVVGYDDNYPKENFTRKVNGEVVEGSTPPGDGALIIKNSWGALTEEDKATVTYDPDGNPIYQNPNANAWGFEDSGYFYLSYYDHSIGNAESFDFYRQNEIKYYEFNYDQYDLLQASEYDSFSYSEDFSTANIFGAEEDEYLCQISYMTDNPLTTVHYAVYKDVEDGDPVSGVLLEEGENTHLLGGYQRIALKGEYFLAKGQKYSVVITQKHDSDEGSLSDVVLSFALDDTPGRTITSIVNPGESFMIIDNSIYDLSDEETREYWRELIYEKQVEINGEETINESLKNGTDSIMFDNFPIKAFLVPARVYGLYSLIGDADCDNEVTILDATAIQRDLAAIEKLFGISTVLADVDGDGVTILDATYIQRWLAGLSCPEGIGEPIALSTE